MRATSFNIDILSLEIPHEEVKEILDKNEDVMVELINLLRRHKAWRDFVIKKRTEALLEDAR